MRGKVPLAALLFFISTLEASNANQIAFAVEMISGNELKNSIFDDKDRTFIHPVLISRIPPPLHDRQVAGYFAVNNNRHVCFAKFRHRTPIPPKDLHNSLLSEEPAL